MSIDEVDNILQIGEQPSRALGYIAFMFMFIFWGSGGYILYVFLGRTIEISGLLGEISAILLRQDVLIVLSIAFVIMIAGAFLYLFLIHKLARELLLALFVIAPIGLILAGIGLLMYFNELLTSAISILIGVILLILFMIYRKRISLAGRMIELSAKAVIDEKGILFLVLVKIFIIAWTAVSWIASLIYWTIAVYGVTMGIQYGALITIVFVLAIFFVGLWVLIFLDTFFSAAIVRIVHDWYRSPEVDVASVPKGIHKALEVSGSLAKYSLVFAIFSFTIELARRYSRRGRGFGAVIAKILAWVLGITRDVLRFLGFYMIPAMVIRKAGFKRALEDSIHKLRDLFIETLAGAFGFGIVLGIIAFITASIFGVVGYFIGAYVFMPLFGLYEYGTTIGIASGIAFFVITFIPIGIASSAVSVAWKTILYEYGLDIEYAMKGVYLPARLPEDIKASFSEMLREKGVTVAVPA